MVNVINILVNQLNNTLRVKIPKAKAKVFNQWVQGETSAPPFWKGDFLSGTSYEKEMEEFVEKSSFQTGTAFIYIRYISHKLIKFKYIVRLIWT